MFIFVLNQHKISSCILLMIFTIISKSRWITLGHSFHCPLSTVIHITQTFLKCFLASHYTMAFVLPISLHQSGSCQKHMAHSSGTTENNLIKFPLKSKGKTAGNGKGPQLSHHWLLSAGETEETSQKGCHRNKLLALTTLSLSNLLWAKSKGGQRART